MTTYMDKQYECINAQECQCMHQCMVKKLWMGFGHCWRKLIFVPVDQLKYCVPCYPQMQSTISEPHERKSETPLMDFMWFKCFGVEKNVYCLCAFFFTLSECFILSWQYLKQSMQQKQIEPCG